MPTRKGIVFINSSSGAKLAAELTAFRDAATSEGLEVIDLSPSVDTAAVIRRALGEGVRLFVAAGGDGTINHIVQPLVNSEAVFAVIPLGTYNHFAKDLGIPLEWREALEIAVRGTVKQIDVGRVNERYFVNNLSIGLYPELVARREARGRDYPRWKARLIALAGLFERYPYVGLTIDSEHHHEVVRTHVFMVSNNSYDLTRIGIDAPRASLEEGMLSLYWLPHISRLALMKFVAHFLAGRVRTAPGFRSFRTKRAKVQSPRSELKIGIDGEVLNLRTPLVITTVPQSLLVKGPRDTSQPSPR